MFSAAWTRIIKVLGHQHKVKVSSDIVPHRGTDNPTQLWGKLQKTQIVKTVEPMPLCTPINEDKVRFVCMSDTHNINAIKTHEIPHGDVFLHAGDFTNIGQTWEIIEFNEFLGNLSHMYKIVIAGNHELSFDKTMMMEKPTYFRQYDVDFDYIIDDLKDLDAEHASDLLTNCIYLEDSGVTVFGISIYGSPWQPHFNGWGFNLPRGQPCLDKWNLIPEDVDVLITHGPPLGHGDLCLSGARAGCMELLSTVQQLVRPKYHLFGHIHEDYGITTDGNTTFINASTCTVTYRPDNPPIIFDIPLPEGTTKQDFLNS